MFLQDLARNASGNEWTSTGKKKGGMGAKGGSKGKMVIDGACLGFTPTGDSSRINKVSEVTGDGRITCCRC